jgi:excisionase family DNA binding protein
MQLMTMAEVAARLRITRQWAYVLARQGVLPSIRINRTVRVDAERLARWLDQGGSPGIPEQDSDPRRDR